MPQHRPVPQPWCATCGGPILAGEVSALLHGDLIHEACETASDDMTHVAAGFLRQAAPRSYCSFCLAAMLALAQHEVQRAIMRLRAASEFGVALGVRCARCREARVTIAAKSRAA